MTTFWYQGAHAIVSGGLSGIGAGIVDALVASGCRVSVLDFDQAKVEQEVNRKNVFPYLCDVTDPVAVKRVTSEAIAAHGDVAILVNNAGSARSAPFADTTLDDWYFHINLNATAVFVLTQAVLPSIRRCARGRIITVVSTAGKKGYPYVSAYCAAKHAALGLTRALAIELARQPITVNALCPGFADTPMLQQSIKQIMAKTGKSAEQIRQELAAGNPQQRLITPLQVADAALWLLGENADAITGQSIVIAGGEIV